jgi:hypothetical protein
MKNFKELKIWQKGIAIAAQFFSTGPGFSERGKVWA